MSNNFDIAIIGSGIGGLTCGALLAQKGKRVCIVEKHFQIGGCAQSFSRKGFTFDSSVHSAPMADDGFICSILSELGIRNDLEIIPYATTMQAVTPSSRFSYPRGIAKILQQFRKNFPNDSDAIVAILNDMAIHLSTYKGNPGKDRQALVPSSMSYAEYIASFISNVKLQALFHTIWPFGGTSPAVAPLFNSLIFYVHALEGNHYIKGGFAKLAKALASVIIKNNGQIRTNWEVCSIRMGEPKQASSIVSVNGDSISATQFVSNISPYILHMSIIPEKSRSKLWLSRLGKLHPSISAFCVYCGIEGDASDIVENNILLWFSQDDHDAIYNRIISGPPDLIDHLIIMRPPGEPGKNTLTFIYFTRHDAFDNWGSAREMLRDAILLKAKSLFGDFSKRILVCETATPKTIERYTGNTNGALYGFENVKELYGQSKLPFTTHISNIFQVGHWTKSGNGIYNVMASAKETVAAILNS